MGRQANHPNIQEVVSGESEVLGHPYSITGSRPAWRPAQEYPSYPHVLFVFRAFDQQLGLQPRADPDRPPSGPQRDHLLWKRIWRELAAWEEVLRTADCQPAGQGGRVVGRAHAGKWSGDPGQTFGGSGVARKSHVNILRPLRAGGQSRGYRVDWRNFSVHLLGRGSDTRSNSGLGGLFLCDSLRKRPEDLPLGRS